MAENRKPTAQLVQRWYVIEHLGVDGRVHRRSAACSDRFDSLAVAVAHYRRALDGAWAHPTWVEWGVIADADVIREAGDPRDDPIVPPGETRAAMARFASQPRLVDTPPGDPAPESRHESVVSCGSHARNRNDA